MQKFNHHKIMTNFLPVSLSICFGCKELSHRDDSFDYPHHMFCLRNKNIGPSYNFLQVIHNLSLWTVTDRAVTYDQVKSDAQQAKKDMKIVSLGLVWFHSLCPSQQLWSYWTVSSPNHTFFLGKLDSAFKQYFKYILLLVPDNNPS